MAKESKKSTTVNNNLNANNKLNNSNLNNSTKKGKSIIPEKYQNISLILLLGLLIIIFFRGAIFDGSFWGATDNINTQCFQKYISEAETFPLWLPYVFCGTPGFAAMFDAAARHWDVTAFIIDSVSKVIKEVFNSDAARVLLWYFLMGTGMFLLLRQYKQERLIAFFAAISIVFCTGIAIWVMIGHNTKPIAFMMLPYVLLMFERTKEKTSILNIVLFCIVMHIMLWSNHIQMIFYSACMVWIYLLFDLITQIIKKGNWIAVTKAIGVLVLATGMAFLMSADRYLSVLEYTEYSTRGTAPILQQTNQNNKQTDENSATQAGKDYEYSTMWSFSPNEMIDFFVPSYHGFGKVDYSGVLTGNRETKLMTYWGQKPFEDATPYMSAVVMFLAILGILRYFKTNTVVQAMTVAMLFGLFLSFGYTFPVLYDLFFYHFPRFSSFRAPSMALALMHFTVPILAAFGLKTIGEMSQKVGNFKQLPKEEKVPIKIFFATVGIFIVGGFIFAAGFETSYILDVTSSKALSGYGEQTLSMLAPFIWDNMISDWTVIGFIVLLACGIIYMFINKKIPHSVFICSIILLVLIDLWRVTARPMEFVDKNIEKQPFPQTDVVNFILKDKQETGEYFRICDMSSQVVNSNAYFLIENINGYNPAKLRNFQDMMDVMCQGSTSMVTHPFLWNITNAKYIISTQKLGETQPIFQSQQTGAFVYFNPSYCKRAFFVDTVKVAEPLTILNNMNESNFNPKTVAFVEKPLEKSVVPSGEYDADMKEFARLMAQQSANANPDSSAQNAVENSENIFTPKAKITEYKNEFIKIETETKGQHLLVLSEIYYPAGWKAFIDGQETEIIKTNYAFRSIVVPAGNHTVEFKYESEKFILGKALSAGSNIIIILGLILGLFLENRQKKSQ